MKPLRSVEWRNLNNEGMAAIPTRNTTLSEIIRYEYGSVAMNEKYEVQILFHVCTSLIWFITK